MPPLSTQESMPTQSSFSGYGRKRRRSSRSAVTPYRRVPRSIGSRNPGQRTVVALSGSRNFPLTADPTCALSFDMSGFYVNGTVNTIQGLSELVAVYDMLRVMKVEVTLLPAANSLDLANQTITSGVTNIPYIYHAIDFNDETTPTLAELQQNPTTKIDRADRVIRRTFYPRVDGSNGIIDVGTNHKNLFMRSNASSTQKWFGFKWYGDMVFQTWTYGNITMNVKVFYECMQSK